MADHFEFRVVCHDVRNQTRDTVFVERLPLVRRPINCAEAIPLFVPPRLLGAVPPDARCVDIARDRDVTRELEFVVDNDSICAECAGSTWRLAGGYGHQRIDSAGERHLVSSRNRHERPRTEVLDITRGRWAIRCPKCGLRADTRRATAESILSELADSGRRRVELGELVGRISNS